jgi:hypothetical protein
MTPEYAKKRLQEIFNARVDYTGSDEHYMCFIVSGKGFIVSANVSKTGYCTIVSPFSLKTIKTIDIKKQ